MPLIPQQNPGQTIACEQMFNLDGVRTPCVCRPRRESARRRVRPDQRRRLRATPALITASWRAPRSRISRMIARLFAMFPVEPDIELRHIRIVKLKPNG